MYQVLKEKGIHIRVHTGALQCVAVCDCALQ